MNEDIYKDPMKEYMNYLKRFTNNKVMTLPQAHQFNYTRLVAEMYGVTEQEMRELDERL